MMVVKFKNIPTWLVPFNNGKTSFLNSSKPRRKFLYMKRSMWDFDDEQQFSARLRNRDMHMAIIGPSLLTGENLIMLGEKWVKLGSRSSVQKFSLKSMLSHVLPTSWASKSNFLFAFISTNWHDAPDPKIIIYLFSMTPARLLFNQKLIHNSDTMGRRRPGLVASFIGMSIH